MAKTKKPSWDKVVKQLDSYPDEMFGKVDIDLSTLPCLRKVDREKITTNIDSDVLKVMKSIAKKHGTSYSALMNDVLRRVFIDDKKAG